MPHARSHTSLRTGAGRPSLPRRLYRLARSAVVDADRTLALWHERARSRREIERLDERLVRDARVDRAEASKPFWRE